MKGTTNYRLFSSSSRRLVGRRWDVGNNYSSSNNHGSDQSTIFCFHSARATAAASRRWGAEPSSSSSSSPQVFVPLRREISSQEQQQQQTRLVWRISASTTSARRYFSSSSLANHRSLSSSAVAAVVQSQDDDSDDSPDDEQQQQQLELRPRLQALRQRLVDERISTSGKQDDSILSLKPPSNKNKSSCAQPSSSVVKVQHHVSNQQSNQQHEESLPSSSSSSSLHPITITKSTDLETIDTMDLLRRLEEMEETAATTTTNNNNDSNSSSMLLQDSFGRRHDYLRISLTERCNLRCTYCMPEAGVALQPAEHLLQTPELLKLASHFYHELGVSKFRLTGGEPTLRHDLVQVVQGLSSLYDNVNNNDSKERRVKKPQIGMTTNGIVLAKHLPALYDAGLTSVNVSLDTLDANKFAALTRRPAAYLDRVVDVIEMLTTQEPYKSNITTKINCVVQRHVNDNELVDFVKHFCHDDSNDRASGRNLNAIRFIEYMPFTENGWDLKKLVPHHEMLQILQEQHGSIETLAPTDPHDTTTWYTTSSSSSSSRTSGAASTTKIGFITSMSNHFCAGCNRLRLTADGQLQVCLFGTNGRNGRVSLRDALRGGTTPDGQGVSPRQLNLLINYALSRKHYKLGGHDSPTDIMQRAGTNNRPMTLIGG